MLEDEPTSIFDLIPRDRRENQVVRWDIVMDGELHKFPLDEIEDVQKERQRIYAHCRRKGYKLKSTQQKGYLWVQILEDPNWIGNKSKE